MSLTDVNNVIKVLDEMPHILDDLVDQIVLLMWVGSRQITPTLCSNEGSSEQKKGMEISCLPVESGLLEF